MVYDQHLAERIRRTLAVRGDVVERKMFGGIAFMIRGNMCCGVLNDELILRLGPAGAAAAMRRAHTKAFDFTGRPMNSMVVVEPAGHRSETALRAWLEPAVAFAAALPAK